MATKSGDDKAAATDADQQLEMVTLQLPVETLRALRAEAEKRQVSTGDMVRIAIGTHTFLSDAVDKGAKVQLLQRGGKFDVAL